MSEEIKEKLDLFPNNMNDIAKEAYYQLENYITNLQQKVEQLEKENEKLRDKIVELQGYKEAIYEIKKYIDAYSPYFLETQEQNNQTIAIIIDNIGNLGE